MKQNSLGDEKKDSCTSRKSRIYPKVAKNRDGKHRFIIQKKAFSLQQALTITTCVDVEPGKSCTIFDAIGSSPVESQCNQIYGHVTLTVYDVKNKTILEDDFPVPSCCVCKYNSNSIFPLKVKRS